MYMRLVRAGTVQRKRQRSGLWRREDAARRRAVAGVESPAAAGVPLGRDQVRARAQQRWRVQGVRLPRRRPVRAAGGAEEEAPRRKRRHDGQLVYTAVTRAKLGLWVGGEVGGWPEHRVDDG